MFDSNPDLHPLDGSSTHVPAGTIKGGPGDSLEVQWLGLHLPTGSTGLIPGWGTKIPQATQYGQKEKKENKVSKKVGLKIYC